MSLSDDVRGATGEWLRARLRELPTETLIGIGDMINDELTRRYDEGEP